MLFVHNRVHDIAHVAEDVKRLVPEARVAIAHGQMDEGRLERVVQEFWEHEHDVLVCTTIVESGLDMPTVNTLVVDRADMLGLAQLYQLRGRRRAARAARVRVPACIRRDHALTEEAYERLKTIGEFTDLGSGFKIAMRDLEIRGAGNLLGGEQSGHIAAVGFDLYVEMVTEAVGELTGEVARTTDRGADRRAGHREPAARLHRARRRADGGVPPPRRGHRRRPTSTTSAPSGKTGTGRPADRPTALLDVARLARACVCASGFVRSRCRRATPGSTAGSSRKSQEARLKHVVGRAQVLPDAVVVPVQAAAGVSITQALLRLLDEIDPPVPTDPETAPVPSAR